MTIHHYTETATPDATKRYPSDLNNREFGWLHRMLHKRPQAARNALSISVKS